VRAGPPESFELPAHELAQRLAAAEAERDALRAELEETNHGVISLYAELDDRAIQLKQASELKSRFLSYMSHEFRAPLGAVRSIVRILLDELDGPLGSEQRRQLELIRSSSAELSDMVDDLLDLARVEAGRITISPGWFEMGELLTSLRGMFKPLVDSESVTLVLDEPVGFERLYTDDRKLAQILRNFISNALKFTTQGEVRVTAEAVDGMALFCVRDTGIGIPESQLGTLFSDFMQLNSPLHKRYRGSGLGLSLSRKLAELLGGTVGAESAAGVGSTFWVKIPAVYDASGHAAPGLEGSGHDAPGHDVVRE
jgi:signal transduction histidine kinase